MAGPDHAAAIARRYTGSGHFASIEWHVDVAGSCLTSGHSVSKSVASDDAFSARGHADGATPGSFPDRPIYRIYSMTKPIVSVAALMLIERGALHLFDPIAQYAPEFAQMRVLSSDGSLVPANRPITIEDLLTHRAGFTYEFLHGCHVAPYYRDARIIQDGGRPLADMMAALARLPLALQPGTAFRYSVSIDVLAHVIERATGNALIETLNELLFEPLDLQDTAFQVAPEKRDRLLPMWGAVDLHGLPSLEPVAHELKPLDVEEMYPTDNAEFRRGGHGLFSTLPDYLEFALALQDGQGRAAEPLLSRKMLEMLRANRIPPQQLPLRIGMNVMPGYGWGLIGRVMLDSGLAVGLTGVGEFGWSGAASTYFWVDPVERMSGVVMTQYLGSMVPLSEDMRLAAYRMLP